VEKEYIFDTPRRKKTLADVFEDRSQLIIYHFMLGPGWAGGLPRLLLPGRSSRRDPAAS
jgi:predicted dithiol-disulfide oxidoreductase (DUF899 family)